MDKQSKKPALSRLEQRILGIVYELGECSSADVIASQKGIRKLAPTTIRTVLANLRKKGYLTLVPTTAREYRFKAAVSRKDVARSTLRELASGLFGGSPRQALSYLIDVSDMDDGELDALGQLIQEKQAAKAKKKGKEA